MPGDVEYGAQPVVKIDGRPLSEAVELLVEEVSVHDHLHLPDMIEIRFRDDRQEVLDLAGATIGGSVALAATSVGRGATERPLFDGEITALESEYDAASGTHTVLRGYDRSHRLMKQRHTRAWLDTDLASLVRSVGSETGLQVTAESSPVRYEYVAQVNESNWSFLRRLARETGHEVTAGLGELQLRRPPRASDAPAGSDVRQEVQPLQVVLGTNLRSLRVRITAAAQVQEVTVRAWDWKGRRPLVGRARARTETVQVRDEPQALARTFSASPAMACELPLDSQDQLDAAAGSLAELIAAASAEAYGVVDGAPELRAGEAVSISNAGARFDGKYVVTASRHVFDEEGFRTHFEITGRQERSVLGLTSGGGQDDPRFEGVVVAVVTNNDDPEGYGRVKLTFPWLADDLESSWARVATFDAGRGDRGSLFLPEVGDEVLVAFEHGDFRRPFVVGRLWNGRDRVPVDDLVDSSGAVNHRQYRSRLGHLLRFSDKPGASHVELATADGKRRVVLDESGHSLRVVVDRTTVEITDGGDVSVDATANVTIKATGNLTLQASGAVEVKGATVKVEGSGQTEIKGGVLRLN
jgi:uncharacterized protein involved in type VI secretion and phage assembly